jgi:hypothetical protein
LPFASLLANQHVLLLLATLLIEPLCPLRLPPQATGKDRFVHHIAAEQAIPNPRPQAPTPATRCGNSRATVVRHLLRGRFAEGRRPRPFSGPAAATARATSVSCYSPASQPVPLACGTGRRHRAPLPEHCCHGGPLSVSPSTLSPLPSPPPSPASPKSTPPTTVLLLDLSRPHLIDGRYRIG